MQAACRFPDTRRVRVFDPAGSCVKQDRERRVLTARGKPQVHEHP